MNTGLFARVTSGGARNNPGPSDYSIKSKLGDSPRWSIKNKYEERPNVNTAPYRALPSKVGEGPKAALASRHKELEGMNTPGPNYDPPKLGADAPKAALSSRYYTARDPRAANPGPGEYEIKPRFANDANKYTLKSRNRVEGENVSPGPAAYTPRVEATKKKAPEYSLHIRPEERRPDKTPGPSDYQVSRDLGGQKSTMHVRPRNLSTDNTPGPGAYTPTDADKAKNPQYTIKQRHASVERPNTAPYRALPSHVGEGPKIALASRHKELEGMNTPGPNYDPPKLGADAPKAALSSRYYTARDPRAANPGPGEYEIKPRFANDANKYTLKSRNLVEGESVSPGPAAYTPRAEATKPKAPQYSLHIRPDELKRERTPGPSDYQISRDLGGQKSTMHVRPQTVSGDSNPGPGTYSPTDADKSKNPRFTIKGKYEEHPNVNTAPYRALPSKVGEGPKIALASRHKELEGMNTPGPNYDPPKLGHDAPKAALSSRYYTARDPRAANPGPGEYEIKPRFANDANKYTLKSRNRVEGENVSPGPAAYTPRVEATKKKAPEYSLHIRPEERRPDKTPGPSDYQVSRDLGGQKSTMHVRPRNLSTDNTPGPGAYTPTDADKAKNPQYTIKQRHASVERPNTAPYRALPSHVGEGPKIALASRHKELEGMNTPGPNYDPPKLGADAPKAALSSRYYTARDPRAANPGPGEYEIKPRFANDANKYTLKSRNLVEGDHISPGPAAYTPNSEVTKPTAPRYSLHIRPNDPKPFQTPGYLKLPSTLQGPKYSIGNRESLDLLPC